MKRGDVAQAIIALATMAGFVAFVVVTGLCACATPQPPDPNGGGVFGAKARPSSPYGCVEIGCFDIQWDTTPDGSAAFDDAGVRHGHCVDSTPRPCADGGVP